MKETGKDIRIILNVLFGIVLFSSLLVIIRIMSVYRAADILYESAVSEFVIPLETGSSSADTGRFKKDVVPIAVDFEALRKINGDVTGWIYCEGTQINYPVLQGTDNDYYLHHTYDMASGRSGSIFMDAYNRPDLADFNTIIYGHHMKDGSMFAELEKWSSQEYYEAHPVFWLLTPERTYQILLISGYTTAADSDTYTIYQGSCHEFEDYLRTACENSDFRTDVEWNANGRFVVLSTCSYAFEDARYVLHGMLTEE